MERTFKTIGIIATMGIMFVLAFWLGTTQESDEKQLVENVEEVEKVVEVVPNGYIDMYSEEFRENFVDMRDVVYFESSDDGLQLYFADGSGYWWER